MSAERRAEIRAMIMRLPTFGCLSPVDEGVVDVLLLIIDELDSIRQRVGDSPAPREWAERGVKP